MLGAGKNTIEIILAARDRTRAAFAKVNTQMKGLEGVGSKLTKTFKNIAKAGAAIGAAAVIAGIAGSTKAFMDFEDAMANVRKTTGFTKEETSKLGEAINDLALRIPVAQTELAGIAAVAGQLGITGQKNILDFTETAAKMSTAFDMSAESVAIAAAKLANIYDIPISQVSNLGSAINVLGNTTAASESQIMAFSMSLGPTAQQLGFAATEAISLGASMISIGMDASNAGTRLNRAFSMIGQNLDELASFMGVTTEEFTASFEEMPMETFMGVLEKLSQVEGKLKANTVASELFNEIGAKAIKGLTGNLNGLRTNLVNSKKGFEDNTSLAEEFAAKTDTLKARFQLLKNSITSLLIDIGGELAPTLNQVIEGVRNILPPLKDLILEIGSGFREMFESITRQAGAALDPLITKVKEAGKKMSKGLNLKTLLDDIGVFIGAGLKPLIDTFGWLIDKLGPLWDLIGSGTAKLHELAIALKTEEGLLDDLRDATDTITASKIALYDIIEKLNGNINMLSEELKSAGAWTSSLAAIEAAAKTKTDALVVARKLATEAVAKQGMESNIAKKAIENVKKAEEEASTATDIFNATINESAQLIIDLGIGTDGLKNAQLELKKSSKDTTVAQNDLKRKEEEVLVATEKVAGKHIELSGSLITVAKSIRDYLIIELDKLEYNLNASVDLILKIGPAIEKGLTFAFPSYAALKKSFKDLIVLEDRFVKKTDSSMDAIATTLSAAGIAMGASFKLFNSHILDNIKLLKTENEEASKSWEERVAEIKNQLEIEKKGYRELSYEAKVEADKRIGILNMELKELEGNITEENKYLESLGSIVNEVDYDFKEFNVTIGDTTIEFKGAAAEVVKNADAYEKLQDSAQTLLDLNWSVFSEFEASLPNIQSGIGNMESAFVGLKDILEDNIGALENVKQSVTGISEIAAPFLEKGFAESVKAISKFAGALKDAGSAISDFGGLQDVSIEGCIKFSLHIHDMVSALGILKDQMRDLEPLFSSLNSLIGDLSESFVYSGDKVAGFTSSFSEFIEGQVGGLNDLGIGYAETTAPMEKFFGFIEEKGFAQLPEAIGLAEMTKSLKYATQDFSDMGEIYQKMISRGSFSWLEWSSEENDVRLFTEEVHNAADAVKVWEYATTMRSVRGDESALITSEGTFQIKEHTRALGTNIRANQNWIKSNYGVRVSTEDMYAVMQKPPEEQQKWFEEMLRTGPAIAHQWDKQTAAISANGKKLKQLTDAMQPHLAFMRTMNELAALSTLSTAELNAGLDAITDTLTNLGTVLNTFDLRSTMESLFGTKIPEGDLEGQFTGGFATPFVDVLQEFAGPFNELIVYSTRLTSAITGLVSAFDTLNDISDSVLLDTTALTEVFEDMVKILNNLEEAFGKNGFGETLADALGDMIKSAAPLTDYFQKNNAAVIQFNNTLGMFKTTITNVVDTMELLKKMSEMVLPSVDELEAGFDKAKEAVLRFDKALLGHMGMGTEGTVNMEKNLNTVFRAIIQFAEDWSVLDKSMGDSFEVFEDGIDTITKLISSIVSLVSAFESMKDIAIPSATEMGTVFDEIGKGITEFTKVVRTKFPAITPLLVTFDEEWQKHKLTIDNTLPSLKEAINTYTTLISLAISLTSAYDSLAVKEGELAKIRVISAKDLADALKDIPKIITELSGLIDLPIWTDIIAKLGEFKPKWDEISKGVKESVDSFSEVISIFTSIISSAKSLSDTFTDLEEIVVITADQIETAFKDIPSVIDEVISYLTRKSFTDIKEALKSVHAEWAKHKAVIDETMPSFNAAIDTITTLVSKVLSLSSAFVELKDMSVLSVRDIDEAMKKIPEFLDRFVDALRLNMTGIKEALSDLDKEWAKHAEEMEGTMPSFTTATSEIGTLISTVLSLNSALDELSSMGVIHGREFDKGFSSLITSISNFAVSLAKNVDELMISLNQLRVVWIENEAVLLPLMKDFAIITDNLWGVAHNANRMAKEFDAITKNSKTLEKGFASLITFINQVVEGTKKFYTPEAAAEISGFIEDVGKVIDAFVDLEIELQNAMGMVKTKISNAVGDIKEKLSSLTTLVASAETWGANIMSSYISGIRSKSEELRLAVADQAAIVEDYLGAKSPTRLGPLSKLNEWPENLMRSYSAGIENEMPSLNQTFGLLAPNMGAASPAEGNRKVDIYVTQHIGSRADADYSAEALRRIITRHEVM